MTTELLQNLLSRFCQRSTLLVHLKPFLGFRLFLVVRSALQNAASIASLLLTTEAVVCESPGEKADNPMGGGMPSGGGMY